MHQSIKILTSTHLHFCLAQVLFRSHGIPTKTSMKRKEKEVFLSSDGKPL